MDGTQQHRLHVEDEIGKWGVVHGQTRRKGTGTTRLWLIVTASGQSHLEEVEKHSVMRRTGLPNRDLRVLDPLLSYPSTILGREKAIVVNLEHIKAIITANEVLMINSSNPLMSQFVQDLQDRVSSPKDIPRQDNAEMEDEAGEKTVPFEFKALESCLESACRCLESETQTLEHEAYPALDELTSKISTMNLERVRQIKSRLVAISGRVQKVRDELEHLLDDDNDMAEMYLTEKLDHHSREQTSLAEETQNEIGEDDDNDDDDDDQSRMKEDGSKNDSESSINVEELEMLLEAYFAQIDGISQQLSNMTEYVDDTEDFINIMLDDKQNQLLQMGVMLSTANMVINAGIVVVGFFGMNITISLYDNGQPIQFWETTLGTIGGCIVFYLIALGWGKKKNLI
ncbi:magnesium transporter MRS2-F-like [Impatiens glandulifera]|uniref:magnesium transporter MRS2-F-like n=1 Tax=Impatiens glandulifera TaxID=253017 RepID=UPI001FB0B78F|nr:magnesium transporter MRS2-F-like [Impatiens glandulifera]